MHSFRQLQDSIWQLSDGGWALSDVARSPNSKPWSEHDPHESAKAAAKTQGGATAPEAWQGAEKPVRETESLRNITSQRFGSALAPPSRGRAAGCGRRLSCAELYPGSLALRFSYSVARSECDTDALGNGFAKLGNLSAAVPSRLRAPAILSGEGP